MIAYICICRDPIDHRDRRHRGHLLRRLQHSREQHRRQRRVQLLPQRLDEDFRGVPIQKSGTKILNAPLSKCQNVQSGPAVKESIYSNWLPLDRSHTPHPRPGKCHAGRRGEANNATLSESSMNFVKRHSLMDWAVQSSRKDGPLFVKTSMAERLTVVGVDAGVTAVGGGASFDVIFVGTTSGRILRLAYPKAGNATAVLVESIQVHVLRTHKLCDITESGFLFSK